MISVLWLKQYLENFKTNTPAINKTRLVVDDSQLSNRMNDFTTSDNQFLVGLLPSYDKSRSTDVDNIRDNNYLGFLILEKVDYSEMTEEEELEVHQRTQETMSIFENKLLQDIETGVDGQCPEFQFLDISSIKIDPIWMFAQCNGWMLTVTIENNSDELI